MGGELGGRPVGGREGERVAAETVRQDSGRVVSKGKKKPRLVRRGRRTSGPKQGLYRLLEQFGRSVHQEQREPSHKDASRKDRMGPHTAERRRHAAAGHHQNRPAQEQGAEDRKRPVDPDAASHGNAPPLPVAVQGPRPGPAGDPERGAFLLSPL